MLEKKKVFHFLNCDMLEFKKMVRTYLTLAYMVSAFVSLEN